MASRVLAAVAGGLAVALAGSLCLAATAPDPRGLGFALGAAAVLPSWCAAACLGFLARRARRAWLAYATSTAALGAAAAALLLLRRGG